jgi:hypothetical protein
LSATYRTWWSGELADPHSGVVQKQSAWYFPFSKAGSQLGSKLLEVSWPFTEAYWAGEEKDESIKPGQSWFPWEQKGYWIDGAARPELVLEDEALMQQVGNLTATSFSKAMSTGSDWNGAAIWKPDCSVRVPGSNLVNTPDLRLQRVGGRIDFLVAASSLSGSSLPALRQRFSLRKPATQPDL